MLPANPPTHIVTPVLRLERAATCTLVVTPSSGTKPPARAPVDLVLATTAGKQTSKPTNKQTRTHAATNIISSLTFFPPDGPPHPSHPLAEYSNRTDPEAIWRHRLARTVWYMYLLTPLSSSSDGTWTCSVWHQSTSLIPSWFVHIQPGLPRCQPGRPLHSRTASCNPSSVSLARVATAQCRLHIPRAWQPAAMLLWFS